MPASRYAFTLESTSAFICRLSGGRSLQAVCRDSDMPSPNEVYRQMRRDAFFRAQVEAVRDPGARGPGPGGARRRMWSQGLAHGILAGLREGFSLSEICRSPHCPVSRKAVERWLATRPAFAAAYREACAPRQTARGLSIGRGRRGAYDPQFAHLILDRLLEGRSLRSICADPDMPSDGVLAWWRRRHPAFAVAMNRARRAQLDVLLDEVIEAMDRPRRAVPAVRLVAALWSCGHRPYAGEPIAQGTANWAASAPDGARRARGGVKRGKTGARAGRAGRRAVIAGAAGRAVP